MLCAVRHKATDQSDVPTKTHTSKAAGSRAGSDCTPESGSESDAGSRGGRIYRHFSAEIYCSAAHTLERKGWGDLPCLLPTEWASAGQVATSKHAPQSLESGWTGLCHRPEESPGEGALIICLGWWRGHFNFNEGPTRHPTKVEQENFLASVFQ